MCVVFTLNNPEATIEFDPETMAYLCYQEEVGANGTYHFQGYCEFLKRVRLSTAKEYLQSHTIHIQARRGTQAQAIAYCKKKDGTEIEGTFVEFGEPKKQGERMDLVAFKEAIAEGAKMVDLLDEHLEVLCKYSKFYSTLKMLVRPQRSVDEMLVVTLHIGAAGTGKTRDVEERFGSSGDFWTSPLSNGTMWFDGYDGQSVVLLDDIAGAASHISLCGLLRLLDRYPLLVPTKGGHTWWMPTQVFVTTNVLPKDWYKWTNREEQYKALARRFTTVLYYHVPLSGTDRLVVQQESVWWEENAPQEATYIHGA